MNNNVKIKVVKKEEIRPVLGKKAKGNTARLAAREMVSTVTDWVTEFKQRKSEETKAAIDKFLPRQPKPNEL